MNRISGFFDQSIESVGRNYGSDWSVLAMAHNIVPKQRIDGVVSSPFFRVLLFTYISLFPAAWAPVLYPRPGPSLLLEALLDVLLDLVNLLLALPPLLLEELLVLHLLLVIVRDVLEQRLDLQRLSG